MASVRTVTNKPGQIKFLELTNIGDRDLNVNYGAPLAFWMTADMIPRLQGYVSDGSRRYKEWQTLAFEATTVREEEELEAYAGPLVDRPTYEKPTRISTRPDKESETIEVSTGIATRSEPDCNTDGEIQDEYTVGEINEVKDVISTKGSCAANAVRKTLERSSEVDGVDKERYSTGGRPFDNWSATSTVQLSAR